MNTASNEGKIVTEEFDIEFQKICGKYNISYILLDAETRTLKAFANDYEILGRQLLNNLFEDASPHMRVLEKGEEYEIRITLDDRTKTEYIF